MQTPAFSHILSILVSLAAGTAVIFVRLRASAKPVSLMKIIMPPVGMSTGFLMFVVPQTHIPWSWGIASFLVGAVLFSYPLIHSSRFEIRNGDVYLKRSKLFILIIIALLILRLLLHDAVEKYVSLMQTGAIFFILAFGMILPWRLAMLRQFLSLQNTKADKRP